MGPTIDNSMISLDQFLMNKLKHYVYHIYSPKFNKGYIGVRSHGNPENDKYMGSVGSKEFPNKFWKDEVIPTAIKTVVAIFDNKQDAYAFETDLQLMYDVLNNQDKWFNRAVYKDGKLMSSGQEEWVNIYDYKTNELLAQKVAIMQYSKAAGYDDYVRRNLCQSANGSYRVNSHSTTVDGKSKRIKLPPGEFTWEIKRSVLLPDTKRRVYCRYCDQEGNPIPVIERDNKTGELKNANMVIYDGN